MRLRGHVELYGSQGLPERYTGRPSRVNSCCTGLNGLCQLWPSNGKPKGDRDRTGEYGKAIAQVAHERMPTHDDASRGRLLEPSHGIHTGVVSDARGLTPWAARRGGLGIALRLIRRDPLRPHARLVDRVLEERLGSLGVPPLRKGGVNDLSILVDRAGDARPAPIQTYVSSTRHLVPTARQWARAAFSNNGRKR